MRPKRAFRLTHSEAIRTPVLARSKLLGAGRGVILKQVPWGAGAMTLTGVALALPMALRADNAGVEHVIWTSSHGSGCHWRRGGGAALA